MILFKNLFLSHLSVLLLHTLAFAGPTIRPPLLRSGESFAIGAQDFQIDLIMFRIDNDDNVIMWKGKLQENTRDYDDPIIGSSIIEYWKRYNLVDIIEVYLGAKESREVTTTSRSVDGCWYSWKFIPHENPYEISGYIFDTTSMITAGGVEVERQFNEMKASLFRILNHLVRNPLSQMTMGIDAISESLPVLSLTRKMPFITTLGKRITFDATSKQVSEHIESIQKQAALLMRTHTLMEDYISFGDGRLKLHPSCFDLVETVMGIWQKWRDIGIKKRVDVEIEIEPLVPGRHPSITTDKVRLIKCIVTILENAVQSAASYNIAQVTNGEVFLHVGLDKELLRITVQDSGPGMHPEALQALTERLQSGDISFHEDGEMGLGISLALAYHTVVHLFKGKMWLQTLDSETKEMSTSSIFEEMSPTTQQRESKIPIHQFRQENTVGFIAQIIIPLQDDSVVFFSSRDLKKTEAPDTLHMRDKSPCRPTTTTPLEFDERRRESLFARPPTVTFNGEVMYVPYRDHILIADDDPVNLKMLAKILSKEGHKHVLAATNGQEASNMFQLHHKSLAIVLTDIQMPLVTGIELTDKIRIFERTYGITPPMPIVAITASGTGAEARSRCMEAGMVDVLSKPFSRRDINAAITKWRL